MSQIDILPSTATEPPPPPPLKQYADGDPSAEYTCTNCGQSFNRPVDGHLDPKTGTPCPTPKKRAPK